MKVIRIYDKQQLIGRARFDEGSGILDVLDATWKDTLVRLFTTPRPEKMHSGVAPSGISYLAVSRFLEPWTEQALTHVFTHDFPLLGLRAEISSTKVRKYQA
jgi:hypothetical protein